MSSNPINLAVRFILEVIGLVYTGIWSWHQADGALQYFLAALTPLLLAIVWGTFNVPGDKSRSGKAPVKIRGIIRLLIEFGFFFFATCCIYSLGHKTFSLIFGATLVIHYLISIDRIKWLISQKP